MSGQKIMDGLNDAVAGRGVTRVHHVINDPGERCARAEQAVEIMARQEKLLRGEITSLRAQLAAAKENEHLANGTAELAMKHRDAAEAESGRLRAIVRVNLMRSCGATHAEIDALLAANDLQ